MDLGWDGVWSTDGVSPISLSDWDDVELSSLNGTLDGSLDFLVALPSQSDVSLTVSDDDVGLESGSLTGLGLLLDWLNLDNFFLEFLVGFRSQEVINDLGFLDGNSHSEDLIQRVDFSSLD